MLAPPALTAPTGLHHMTRVRNCTAVDLKLPPLLCQPALQIIFNHPILEKVVIITNFGQDNWNEEELCFAGLALVKLFFFFFSSSQHKAQSNN